MRIDVQNLRDEVTIKVYNKNKIKDSVVGKLRLRMNTLCINELDKWLSLGRKGKNAATLRIYANWRPTNSKIKIDEYTNFLLIGIDLGTTCSAAARVMPGMSNNIAGVKVDMIPISMEEGRPILPSFIKM